MIPEHERMKRHTFQNDSGTRVKRMKRHTFQINMAGLDVVAALLALESEESSDEEDCCFENIIFPSTQTILVMEDKCRIAGYVENVVLGYSEKEFKRKFRMGRKTFETVCNNLRTCPDLQNEGTCGRASIPVETQLYMTLWYVGGQDTINKISDRFGVSESSVILSRQCVFSAVLKQLKDKFISWPGHEEIEDVKHKFEERNGFPGIVGAVDRTHIRIGAPKEHPQSYINRNKYHSIQLQCVCRSDMVFTHCFAGFPGSCHDSRVLRNSDLWDVGLQLCQGGHNIADGAYPVRRWLLTPYRDNGHLRPEQRNLNHRMSANRVVIERAFGLLKGRFRRLQYLETVSVETAVAVIMVCCVLHNICLMNNEEVEECIMVQEDMIWISMTFPNLYM